MKFPKRQIIIPYAELILEEAIYRMNHHDGEGYCDADLHAVVLVE
jgi:hypothetical protein